MISSAFSASRSKASCVACRWSVSPVLRRRLSKLGGVEKENRANSVEMRPLPHALHENRADHSAPADKTNIFHSVFSCKEMCAVYARQCILWRILHHTKAAKVAVKLINDSEAISNAILSALPQAEKSSGDYQGICVLEANHFRRCFIDPTMDQRRNLPAFYARVLKHGEANVVTIAMHTSIKKPVAITPYPAYCIDMCPVSVPCKHSATGQQDSSPAVGKQSSRQRADRAGVIAPSSSVSSARLRRSRR